MFKSDRWLKNKAESLITPFHPECIRTVENDTLTGTHKILSKGCSSYGYDLSLSPNNFILPDVYPREFIDPKDTEATGSILHITYSHNEGMYFMLPPYRCGLGVSVECIEMPPNVTAIAFGKSTYARCGVIVNVTPLEAGWIGHLTIAIINNNPKPVRIYANEGICQLLFTEGEPCSTTYADRNGKYQNQGPEVTQARV